MPSIHKSRKIPFSAEARAGAKAEAFAKRNNRFKQPVGLAHMGPREVAVPRGARNHAPVQTLYYREPITRPQPVPRMSPQEARLRVREANLTAQKAEFRGYQRGLMSAQPVIYPHSQATMKKKGKTLTERGRWLEGFLFGPKGMP